MATHIGETTGWDKALYWGLGLFMLAFIASVPSMHKDAQEAKARAWQEQGCQMYDNYTANELPAKCANYFTDHYKPQEMREQP